MFAIVCRIGNLFFTYIDWDKNDLNHCILMPQPTDEKLYEKVKHELLKKYEILKKMCLKNWNQEGNKFLRNLRLW